MEKVSTIGLDIAKHVFQVHGVDALGAVIVRRKLRRDDVAGFFKALPPCLIGIEACATGHHWARILLALGHEVRLMPASYVKPYVKRQKNDATDAEAICEAVTRPTMRFVPVKSQEQQSVLMLHRVRELLIRQRTMLVNALRGHLALVWNRNAPRLCRCRHADRTRRRPRCQTPSTACAGRASSHSQAAAGGAREDQRDGPPDSCMAPLQ